MTVTTDMELAVKSLGRGKRRPISALAMVSLFSSLGLVLVGVSVLFIGVDAFTQMLAGMTG